MKKFSSFLFVLLLMLASFTAHAQEYPRGDVNQDGAVNISDVACLIDNLLLGVSEGDVNQDGVANISDVTSLIDYLLFGSWPDDPVTPPDSHEWVDLGLPSGTLWATCNVSASCPEEFGDYFAWGETAPKDYYDWSTYKWCTGSDKTLTKYCTHSNEGYNGFVDGITELDPEDDAAYVNWGTSWRMPSMDQFDELSSCSVQRIQRNGVDGYLITGPNGNTLFLPVAGLAREDFLVSSFFGYWSRTLSPTASRFALGLYFDNIAYSTRRDLGQPVRAVRVSQE